uniref:Uncharacterized protein n=1 Tax=Tanacetum cinerariifolium TaxID=118510 RepID=A0A6L2NE56_TANCI|nr:hypothetical protein [Tanacetum cinerariifolium]
MKFACAVGTSSQSESYKSIPFDWKSALVIVVKTPGPESTLSPKHLVLEMIADESLMIEHESLEMLVNDSLEMIEDESLDMIVDETLEMIEDELAEMIKDESLDMIMDESLKLDE